LKRDLENSKRNQPIKEVIRDRIKSKSPPNLKNKQPLLDLLGRLSEATKTISHGDGVDKRQLDEDTRESLKLHKLDLKMAEKQVFGRILNPRDWEALNEHDKNVKSEEMLEIVKSRIQKRYAEKGKL
jgi:hypothetical protein